MKLSICNNSANFLGIDQFAYLKKCGFDGTMYSLSEFSSKGIFADYEKLTEKQVKDYFTNLRKVANESGFVFEQTHTPFMGHPGGDGFDYDYMVEKNIWSIKATHYLGCKYAVVHPIIIPERVLGRHKQITLDKCVEFYKRLIPTLEKYDVYCCIENMFKGDPIYKHITATTCSRADELIYLCDKLGDRFKICLDVGHAPLTQQDPAKIVRECKNRIVVLHVHDNDGLTDLHTLPYSAHAVPPCAFTPMRINWEDFMKALAEVGYEGDLAFECGPPGPRALNEAGFKYLAAIGRHLISIFDNAKKEM